MAKGKSKGGRKCMYSENPEYYNTLASKLAKMGLTDKEIYENIGVSETTFYKWKDKFKEFAEAIKGQVVKTTSEIIESVARAAKGYRTVEVKLDRIDFAEVEFPEDIGRLEDLTPNEMIKLGARLQALTSINFKEVAPNVKAATWYTANRMPDNWRMNPDSKPTEDPLEGTQIIFQYHVGDGKYLDASDGEEVNVKK